MQSDAGEEARCERLGVGVHVAAAGEVTLSVALIPALTLSLAGGGGGAVLPSAAPTVPPSRRL